MARILPDAPLGLVLPEELRVFRLIESLPEGWLAWQALGESSGQRPRFWILREKDLRGVCLDVSGCTEEQARGPGLFDSVVVSPWLADRERQAECTAAVCVGINRLPLVRLFPLVPTGMLPSEEVVAKEWIGKEVCKPKAFLEWLENQLGPTLSVDEVQKMRAWFCPETVVQARPLQPQESLPETPRLLTWKQEELLKTDLDPLPHTRQLAGEFGLLVVQGVAGSGKSLILLHRALVLQTRFPTARVLVLTCNKPLQLELRQRFLSMGGKIQGVDWLTFHGFCLKYWQQPEKPPTLISTRDRQNLFDEVVRRIGKSAIQRTQIDEEFSWILEQGFLQFDEYAKGTRRGRGFRMDAHLREQLWKESQEYAQGLRAKNQVDWNLLPLDLREALRQNPSRQKWDAILIDEAQFFAPVWFDVVRQFLSESGHLFLVADPTQGFLRRGGSWKSQGLTVQGRSRKLDQSFRTTRPILELAWKFWSLRTNEGDPEIIRPRLETMRDGPAPMLHTFRSAREEVDWIVAQVMALLAQNAQSDDILILHDDWGQLQLLLEQLREGLGADKVVDAREAASGQGKVRVCSLNAATGLESAIVIVAGIHRMFEREESLDLDPEARDLVRQENTRKVYMACTRAGYQLILTCAGRIPKELAGAFS